MSYQSKNVKRIDFEEINYKFLSKTNDSRLNMTGLTVFNFKHDSRLICQITDRGHKLKEKKKTLPIILPLNISEVFVHQMELLIVESHDIVDFVNPRGKYCE